MRKIMEFVKRVPADLRQAICSLGVSALLITGALLMLGGYLDSFEDEPDVEASATAPESEDEAEEGE